MTVFINPVNKDREIDKSEIPLTKDPDKLQEFYKKTGLSVLHIVHGDDSLHNYDRIGSYPNMDMKNKSLPTGKYAEDSNLKPLNDYDVVVDDYGE
jgi:hypothetical protein